MVNKGYGLCIGLNKVNPAHYGGWNGALNVCERDAKDLAVMLRKSGFDVETLFTRKATRDNVLQGIVNVRKKAKPGDIVVIYYSGHGGNEIPDTNKDEDDPFDDRYDETWCLYDAQLIDDELYVEWSRFAKGVRIVMMSDSCFSGDVVKVIRTPSLSPYKKTMPKSVGHKTYATNKALYDELLKNIRTQSRNTSKVKLKDKVKASLLFFGSSQEYQTSNAETEQYPKNSLYTAVLFEVLKNKTMRKASYEKLHKALQQRMPEAQMPHLQQLGLSKPAFLKEHPFQIETVIGDR